MAEISNIDIEASEVTRRIADDDAKDVFILNVRNEDDYEESQIPGSTIVPIYNELLQYDYSGLEDHHDDLPEDPPRTRGKHEQRPAGDGAVP